MLDKQEFERRVLALGDEDRDHFRDVIQKLVRCYGKDRDGSAIIVFIEDGSYSAQALTLNCDDMEAYKLIQSVNAYFHAINTHDAPARENYN